MSSSSTVRAPASAAAAVGGHPSGAFATVRRDGWWMGPAATFLGFCGFIAYATWAGMQGANYWAAPYLSPFYSPLLFVKDGVPGGAPVSMAWFGAWPSWWPSSGILAALLPASPAVLILVFPASFRFTCYYYRKAYYRSFAGMPAGCAVCPSGLGGRYEGETKLLVFQNLHRYALYFALVFIGILTWDGLSSLWVDGHFHVGVGSLVLLVNPLLISLYTFGCHSFRHLVGGRLNWFSRQPVRYAIWKKVTWLNERHMAFAWASLLWVAFADVYVRLCASGVIPASCAWR